MLLSIPMAEVANQTFVLPGIANALLSLAYITYINNKIYMIFVKFENIGQVNAYLTNIAKYWKGYHFMVNLGSSWKLSRNAQI